MDPFMDVIDYAPWARGVKSAHYRVLSFSHVYLQYSSPCHYTLAQIICTPHSVVGCLSFSFRTVTHSAPQPSYSEALSRLESEAATFRLVAQCVTACPVRLFEGLHTHPAISEGPTAPALRLEFLL